MEVGAINGSIFAIIALVILVLVFGSFSIWAYINYLDQKQDVDSKIDEAVATAVLKENKKSEEAIEKYKNETTTLFVGPSDYGRLTFEYPKFWSAYQATDVSGGGGVTYQAYLNPVLVPPVSDTTKVALRITIEQKTFDQSVADYQKQIEKGQLKSSAYSDGSHTGTKLVGNFNEDIYGTAVLIKMRDRTLTIRTDGEVFNDNFESILKTVKFNE
jgi:Flp pilus assembly protein TadG